MQRNDLGTQKVVTRRNVRRDLDVDVATAVLHLLDSPVVLVSSATAACGSPGVGVNLEEASRSVGCASIIDLGQVRLDGTVVGTADGRAGARTLTALSEQYVNTLREDRQRY